MHGGSLPKNKKKIWMLSGSKNKLPTFLGADRTFQSQFLKPLANTNATPTPKTNEKKMLNNYLKTIHLKRGRIISLTRPPTLSCLILLVRMRREVSQVTSYNLSLSQICNFPQQSQASKPSKSCYTKWGPGTGQRVSPGSLLAPGPTTVLLNQNLHFLKVPSDSCPRESLRCPILTQ